MSQDDAKEILKNLEKYVKETTSSKEKALEALAAAGITTPQGHLKRHYRS